MKRKKLLTVVGSICLILVLAALLLPACAKEEVVPTPAVPVAPTPAAPTPAAPAEYEWPKTFSVETSTMVGGNYAEYCALAPILEKSTGMTVRVIPEDIDAKRWDRYLKGEFDIFIGDTNEYSDSLEGRGACGGLLMKPLRHFWVHNDESWVFATQADSGITSIYDLPKIEGLKVAVNFSSAGMTFTTTEVLPKMLAGWTPEEAKEHWVFVPAGSYGENVRTLAEGKADIIYMTPTSAVAYEVAAAPHGIRCLGFPVTDEKAWDTILNLKPFLMPGKMVRGIPEALGITAWISWYLEVCREETDQEFIYQYVKWLVENFDSYKDAHELLVMKDIDVVRGFLDATCYPVAEGTIRYLKEMGKWTAEDDKIQEENLELVNKWVEAATAAFAEAEAKGIKVATDNQEWLDLRASHQAGLVLPRMRLAGG